MYFSYLCAAVSPAISFIVSQRHRDLLGCSSDQNKGCFSNVHMVGNDMNASVSRLRLGGQGVT